MAQKYSYRDLVHPSFKDTIKGNNSNTLKLVKTVAEFAQEISLAHEEFASQIQKVVELFRKKNQDLSQDRPVEYHSTLCSAWENLLQETQVDAQAHADTASLLIKNVHNPLLEIATYKKSQSKKLSAFRENYESMLAKSDGLINESQKAYIEAYKLYRSNMNGLDALKYLAAYHNAHNEYVLNLRASNCQQQEYSHSALPYLLEELEEIHIDLANTLNGAIESHALLLLTNANEQSKRFDSILRVCKQVHPKTDIHNFLLALSKELLPWEPKHYTYMPPSDPGIPGSELATLSNKVVVDRHTDANVSTRCQELQKEAMELTSYLKQNQDITQTLVNVCQRNVASHQHAKVYETQEDLCRKRNEMRMANIQLAAIRSQIELLTPKQNGSALEADSPSLHKSNKSTIRTMWKKAFKSLKRDSQSKKHEKGEREHRESEREVELEKERQRDRDAEREDRSDSTEREDKKYSRTTTRQSSLKKGLLKRSGSKEQAPEEGEPEVRDPDNLDDVFSHLKMASAMKKQTQRSQSISEDEPAMHAIRY